MEVVFHILRQEINSDPKIHSYKLDVTESSTILECLNKIKWELDGTLAFRKNCRNTICGSCAMRINDRSALACKENVGSELSRQNGGEISIEPLGNLPVIKDLIVDTSKFWQNLEAVEPYISTRSRQIPEREFLQTPEERARLDRAGNCIMCGACYSECNALAINPDFVGPHALAKANRTLIDSRDDNTEARLEAYNRGTSGVWGCTRCYMCDAVCPMEVAPLEQISQIKREILQRQTATASRAIRHRRVLIDLVKQGGWLDERKFGLFVVGNYFRDLTELLSLMPLGLRMLAKGKFPLHFEPSAGTTEVRGLIERVQKSEKNPDPS
jgi:succinate dehydrogenase / fumarate reductase, iron-sulfur subunit